MVLTTIDPILTTGNIMFVIFLLGTLFGIYQYFRKPQDINETKFAVSEEKDKNKATVLAQTEAEGKASLLAQQVLTEKEYNSKKFIELGDRFSSTDRKIETLTASVNAMNLSLSNELTKVGTIIEQHMKITI